MDCSFDVRRAHLISTMARMTYPQPKQLHQNHLVIYYKALRMRSRGKHRKIELSIFNIIFTSHCSKIECLCHRLTLLAPGSGGDDTIRPGALMLAVTDFHLCILQGLNNRNKQNIVQIFVQVKPKLNLEIWCVWGFLYLLHTDILVIHR